MHEYEKLPPQEKEIYDETFNTLSRFLTNFEYEKFYYYMQDKTAQNFKDILEGKETRTLSNTPVGKAIDDVIHELSHEDDPEYHKFLANVFAFNGLINDENMRFLGESYDFLKKSVSNGEVPVLESIAKEEKLTDDFGRVLAANKTEAGKQMGISKAVSSNMYMLIADSNHIDKIRQEASKAGKALRPSSTDYDKETLSLYSKKVGQNVPNLVHEYAISGDEQTVYEVALHDTKDLFVNIPKFISDINTMSYEQLKVSKTEIDQDIEIIKPFEEVASEWAKKADALAKLLDQEVSEEVKKEAEYQKLYKAVQNASRIGGKMDHNIIVRGEPLCATVFGYQDDAIQDSFEEIKAAFFKYDETKIPSFDKIAKLLAENQESLKEAFTPEIARIHKKYGAHNAQTEKLSILSDRIAEKIDLKEIERFDTVADAEIATQRVIVQDLETNKNTIRKFAADSRRMVDETCALLRYFDRDKKDRTDLQKPEEHVEYLNLTQELVNIRDRSRYHLSPQQMIDKIKAAKVSAKTYVDTHAGILNITKGWSAKGRERIDQAQKIYDTLDEQLKKYEKIFQPALDLVGPNETIREALQRLDHEQELCREKVKELQNGVREKIMAQEELKNGPIDLDKVMIYSRDKLKSAPGNEATRTKALASIVAVNEIKAGKNGQKEVSGEAFKNLQQDVMNRESFKKTLKDAKPEDLIQKALDGNGKKLADAVKKNEKTHVMGK
ncbi:MAG: hypothetical protein K6E18_08360 [Lachnospiraceae bacterium]|nr:hypothetical protein [Lachnospiraceae bacterium]